MFGTWIASPVEDEEPDIRLEEPSGEDQRARECMHDDELCSQTFATWIESPVAGSGPDVIESQVANQKPIGQDMHFKHQETDLEDQNKVFEVCSVP